MADLRLSNAVLGRLARPGFSARAGEAIGQAMLGPENRKKEEEEKAFYEQLMSLSQKGDSASVGQLLAQRGVKKQNPQMIMQGTGMMADSQKQTSLVNIEGFMDIYANPTSSVEERSQALAQAEAVALSSNVNMTPQSFNALVASATDRHEKTLNTQAKLMVSANPAGAIEEYTQLYGKGQAWRVRDALQSQTATKSQIKNQTTNAFVASQRPAIVQIENAIAQYKDVPINEWDMSAIQDLFSQRFKIEQEIVNQGGEGNPSNFIGGADRFYDEVFALQSNRKQRMAEQEDEVIENQRNFLYGMAKQGTMFTSDQFVDRARKIPAYSNWEESDWDALEQDISSYRQTRENKTQHLKDGVLAPADEAWLNKYPNYFSTDDEFSSDLKVYRATNTDNLTRLSVGNRLTTKIRDAKANQRQNARSDARIKEKAVDFIDGFIGAGNPDDPRFDPDIPVEGAFMQGDSVYDVVRRLKLTGDDRYDKLVSKVSNIIKDNPEAPMRETVMEAFKELYIETPGEEGVKARQAEIAGQVAITREGIARLQKEYKEQTGEVLSNEQAAMMIQENLADALAADAARMSTGIKRVRQQSRPQGRTSGLPEATRGMNPVTLPEFAGGVADVAGAGLRAIPGGPPPRSQ